MHAVETLAGQMAQSASLHDIRNSILVNAVEQAVQTYTANNRASRELFERAQNSMPGGNTRSALHFDPFPLYVSDSAGAYIRDVDGHRYLDVLGEFTAGLYGHRDDRIARAVVKATERGASNGAPGAAEIELAELVCERFPAIETVRFCNSGTEANLYALTLARIATGRQKLLCFSGAYHGGVFVFGGGGSVMNVPFDWTVCRYNDERGAGETIDRLGLDLAAVIIEPMMSNGGCIAARPDFLRMLRERCTAVGALLIFDEVVTSRMGPGGLQEIHGVLPDLTTLGKYLGAGFSFGAFGGRARIMDLMNPTRSDALPHAGTFNNNVYSMSAGAVGLKGVFTKQQSQTLFDEGENLRDRLNKTANAISPAVQFTGCGSVMNIHFVRGEISCPEDVAHESKDLMKLFHFDLLEAGVYAARRGQINLSLPMTLEDHDTIVTAVAGFLQRRKPLIDATI
ncbi:aminotransferase class III-fold pyridoxal phosphate-dependent enzyme [Mesorhizobium sp. B2-4-19]|uniref:aspartate aminotransferase family protein n=1 Tax=Mesorhizobium sp. B2-4-19 TaxID=2589930 RepID=UPI0015E3D0B5|nr:aminotransferase class III-fold pyridoxal phosphate-dependent enzyme [Mesorhizobium sp. B2-4-19]